MRYKEGQLVIYEGSYGYGIGKIKKIEDDHSAWVWYQSGDTAALTDFNLLNPLINDYCLEDILNKEIQDDF